MPPTDRPWRCFVAVPIGPSLRSVLESCVAELRARPGSDGWRWSDAEGWHVTLAFLGSTDPGSVQPLAEALTEVAAAHAPFELAAGGLGTFPPRGRARVLWFGVADPDGRLGRLARDVRAAVGLPPEDRFRGHLTLARARDRFGTDASAVLASAVSPDARLEVERLVLYRSHLGIGPARYEALAVAPLQASAA